MTFSRGSTLQAWLVALVLAAVTLLLYLPAREHGFVAYDDPDYVADNPMVKAGFTWEGVKWAFTSGHASNWHPLTWLSHMLDAELFGPGPAGPHLTNVGLHTANTGLLFGVLLLLCPGAVWRSAWVAALFALHPLHVESVAWIAERKDVLSGFFFLLTLGAYARHVERAGDAVGGGNRRWYAAALGFFVLGLMSKPMLVTLPCVLLLLDHWPLRRLSLASWREFSAEVLPLLREKIPFFLLSLASCVVTFAVQQRGGAVRSLESFSLFERMENAGVACALYLRNTVWPADLAVFYPHPGRWPGALVAASAALVVAASFVALRAARIQPFVTTGWFWFLGMLVPTLGLVQVGNQALADRYTYLPLIGVFIVLAWGATALTTGRSWPKPALIAVAVLPVVACFALARAQLRHWRDSEALFGRALAVTQKNFVAHNSLGFALLAQGRWDDAILQFEKTLAIRPEFAEAHNNLGNALLQKGRPEEAIARFRKATEYQPGFAPVRYNLGTTLLQQGRVDEAITQLETATGLRPDHVLAHLNLGNALFQAGRTEEAIACYRRVLELRPGFADAHDNLGNALLQLGRDDEAVARFTRAVELQPDHANAHSNLAYVFLQRGRFDEAIGHYRSSLAVRPGDAEARSNLGFALLRRGRPGEAITQYQAALELQPDNPHTLSALAWLLATCPDAACRDGARSVELATRADRLCQGGEPLVLRTLAAAYAETGRFAEAGTAARSALRLAQARGDTALAGLLPAEIERYRAGTPFREPAASL